MMPPKKREESWQSKRDGIIETARENRLNPYAYPKHLFEILPNLDSRDDATLEALLPWNVTLP